MTNWIKENKGLTALIVFMVITFITLITLTVIAIINYEPTAVTDEAVVVNNAVTSARNAVTTITVL